MSSMNGGNNPPIPETMGESSTGAVFSSTDSTKLDQPNIAGPHASTAVSLKHAAVHSDDPLYYIKNQNIPLERFTWSTSQLPGTILYTSPITPLRANHIISYLSGIFNCWAGGLDYQMKIAGTGFHAGDLGIARLPPNKDPSQYKTTRELGTFEYTSLDPKTLEAVAKEIADQRPIAYHYMSDDFSNPDNIGGYIVVFVILQLNTSSTGTNQVDVQIFNKAQPDFRMFQIVPPNVGNSPITDVTKWSTLFATPKDHLHTIFPFPIDTLELASSTTTSAAKPGLRNLSGQLFQDDTYSEPSAGTFANLGYVFYANTATSMIPVLNTSAQQNKLITISNVGGDFLKVGGSVAAANNVFFNASNTVTGATPGSFYNYAPNLGAAITATYGSTPVTTPTIGESLVLFSFYSPSFASPKVLTTTFLSHAFATGEFSIAPNEAVLGQLTSRTTGLPIAYIKIYYSGIITTNAQVTAVTLDFSDLRFEFLAYIQGSQPIPALTFTMLQSLQTIRIEALLARTRQLNLGD